jgi:hypothetical protein
MSLLDENVGSLYKQSGKPPKEHEWKWTSKFEVRGSFLGSLWYIILVSLPKNLRAILNFTPGPQGWTSSLGVTFAPGGGGEFVP